MDKPEKDQQCERRCIRRRLQYRKNKAVAFIMNNKAYIATGQNGSVYKDTWEYDFATDTWKKQDSF